MHFSASWLSFSSLTDDLWIFKQTDSRFTVYFWTEWNDSGWSFEDNDRSGAPGETRLTPAMWQITWGGTDDHDDEDDADDDENDAGDVDDDDACHLWVAASSSPPIAVIANKSPFEPE